MAIKVDMEKMKQKAREEAAAAARQNFGPIPFWKPLANKNVIRIMPPWTADGHNAYQWYRETWVHYNVGTDDDNKKQITCPRRTPPENISACPICEEIARLEATGDPANLEIVKQMKAKRRVYVNMIDLKDPKWTKDAVDELEAAGIQEENLPKVGSPKIQVYGFGVTVFRSILDYYNEDLDLVDLNEGYNVVIVKEGQDINTSYRVRTEHKATAAPVPDDEPPLHNLDALAPFRSVEEMQAILDGVPPEELKKLEEARRAANRAAQLSEGSKPEAKAKPKSEPEAAPDPEPEPEPEPEQETSGGNGSPDEWPPLDQEGNIDYLRVTDEQIEDPTNANVMDNHGNSLYIQCFGDVNPRQRDESDAEYCQPCPLFDRCGERIATVDAAKAAAAKKKKAGKPKAKPKAAGKPKAGKPKAAAKAKKDEAQPGGDDADELHADMMKHLGK
jgi:hypothetical protein